MAEIKSKLSNKQRKRIYGLVDLKLPLFSSDPEAILHYNRLVRIRTYEFPGQGGRRRVYPNTTE